MFTESVTSVPELLFALGIIIEKPTYQGCEVIEQQNKNGNRTYYIEMDGKKKEVRADQITKDYVLNMP